MNKIELLQYETQLFLKCIQENPEAFKQISLSLYNMAQTLCRIAKENESLQLEDGSEVDVA